MVWVREVTTQEVGWASVEASDLVAPPLSLVLYMHLRIFAYTSNALIASFEYMELILASSTLENFRFLLRSCLSTDRAPVIKLICSTFQPWRCITVLMAPRRDAYWFSAVLLALIRTFLHDCFPWDSLFDSSIFYRREGASHLTGSCRDPYRILCQIQIRYILEFGCDVIPYSLEAFLACDAQKLPFWSR